MEEYYLTPWETQFQIYQSSRIKYLNFLPLLVLRDVFDKGESSSNL